MTSFTNAEDCIAHVRELLGDSQRKLFNQDFGWGLLYKIERIRRNIEEINKQLDQYNVWIAENREKQTRVQEWQMKDDNCSKWWSYKIQYPGNPNDLLIKYWDQEHQQALFFHRQDLIDDLYTNLYKLIVDDYSTVDRNIGALIEWYEENKQLLRRHYIKTLGTAEKAAKAESDRIHAAIIAEMNRTGATTSQAYSSTYAWPLSHWRTCYRDLNKHIKFYKTSLSKSSRLGGHISDVRHNWTAHMGNTSRAFRRTVTLEDLDGAIEFARNFLQDFTLVITHASCGSLTGEKEWPSKLLREASYEIHKNGPPPRPNLLRRIYNYYRWKKMVYKARKRIKTE